MKSGRFGIILFSAIASCALSEPYDAIVVGLGASGVGALTRLSRRGYRVLGLESKGRLGGRVNTQEFGVGLVELGAEWIHGECASFKLARQYNISIIDTHWTPSFSTGRNLNFSGRDGLNETAVAELFEHFYHLYYEGKDSDNITVGQYFIKEFHDYVADKPSILSNKDFCSNFLRMFELVLASLDATDSWHDLSIKGDGYYKQCPGSQGWSWHRFGYRTLFDILMSNPDHGAWVPVDIILNKKVTKIDWSHDGTVIVTAGANTYEAKAVIMTVSLGVLKHSHATLFEPSLPVQKMRSIAALSIGVVDRICLYYENIWWGEQTWMVFLWNNEDRSKIPAGDWWIMDINSFYITMSNDHVMSLKITGAAARYMETLNIDVVKEKTKNLLEIFFSKSNVTVPDAKDIRRSTWYSDPDVRGSYSFRGLATDAIPTAVADLGSPLPDAASPRVLFAGEATSAHHFSTVHGALETGWREAERFHERYRNKA